MSGLTRFLKDTSGNTAIMFALSLVPMILGAGVAVDMVQTNYALTVLQSAADAAAIGGASSGKDDQDDIDALVAEYLKANGTPQVIDDINSIEAKLDKSTSTFSVRIKGARKTSLMYLAGFEKMDLDAYAEVKLPGSALEVALVLDNTASMGTSGRMPALKSAAKQLVEDLMRIEDAGAYVKVGIVPFAQYVNVGMSNRHASWMDVPDDYSEVVPWTPVTYPNRTETNCRWVPSYNDGVATGETHKECDVDYGTPEYGETVDVTVQHKWHGCVGSRPDPLDEQIGSLSTRYPGLLDEHCVSEILDLTDDKDDLIKKIDDMVTVGETYVPQGLLWGWNLLTDEVPYTKAKSKSHMNAKNGHKAVILMSDGNNTLYPAGARHNYTYGNAALSSKTKEKMEDICANIKADGVRVYTVSFMIPDADTRKQMADCATSTDMAYSADNAVALSDAFKDIGESLLAIRISK